MEDQEGRSVLGFIPCSSVALSHYFLRDIVIILSTLDIAIWQAVYVHFLSLWKNAWENESEIFTLVNSFREFCPEFWLHSYRLVVKQDIMTGSIGAGELLLLKTAEKEWEEKGGKDKLTTQEEPNSLLKGMDWFPTIGLPPKFPLLPSRAPSWYQTFNLWGGEEHPSFKSWQFYILTCLISYCLKNLVICLERKLGT